MSRMTVDPGHVCGAASRLRDLAGEVDEVAGSMGVALRLVADAAGGASAAPAEQSARAWGRSVAERSEAACVLASVTEAAADAYRFAEAVARGRFSRTPVPAR